MQFKYTEQDNTVWRTLIQRQLDILQNRACDEFFQGFAYLNLPLDHIPQCDSVSNTLHQINGWTLVPVNAFLAVNDFFTLLAQKKFPVVPTIRKLEDIGYSKQPDIFHELFGHTVMLTQPAYANFLHYYGRLCLEVSPEIQTLLGRLFFYTIEVGLINTRDGIRIYGGGVLSSPKEAIYALENENASRDHFDVEKIMKTPYQIEHVQSIYYVLDKFETLYHLCDNKTALTQLASLSAMHANLHA